METKFTYTDQLKIINQRAHYKRWKAVIRPSLPYGQLYDLFSGRNITDEAAPPIIGNPPIDEAIAQLIDRHKGSSFGLMVEDSLGQTHLSPYLHVDIHYPIFRPKKYNDRERLPMPLPVDVDPGVDTLGANLHEGGADPLPFMDMKYRKAYNHIRAKKGLPLTINTASDLIAHDVYIAALDKDNHHINLYFWSTDDQINKIIQPGAPSFKRRLRAYEKLKALGYNVSLVFVKFSNIEAGWNTPDQPLCWAYMNNIKTINYKITAYGLKQLNKHLGTAYKRASGGL